MEEAIECREHTKPISHFIWMFIQHKIFIYGIIAMCCATVTIMKRFTHAYLSRLAYTAYCIKSYTLSSVRIKCGGIANAHRPVVVQSVSDFFLWLLLLLLKSARYGLNWINVHKCLRVYGRKYLCSANALNIHVRCTACKFADGSIRDRILRPLKPHAERRDGSSTTAGSCWNSFGGAGICAKNLWFTHPFVIVSIMYLALWNVIFSLKMWMHSFAYLPQFPIWTSCIQVFCF